MWAARYGLAWAGGPLKVGECLLVVFTGINTCRAQDALELTSLATL
jgi:hypothetical protein